MKDHNLIKMANKDNKKNKVKVVNNKIMARVNRLAANKAANKVTKKAKIKMEIIKMVKTNNNKAKHKIMVKDNKVLNPINNKVNNSIIKIKTEKMTMMEMEYLMI